MIYTLVRKDNSGQVDVVMSFSSINSFDEAWAATVTTQTVERGFNITDNINIDPETYDIQATLSSYSLFDLAKEIVWDGGTFKEVGGDSSWGGHIEARDKLVSLFTDRSILTIVESNVNSNSLNLTRKQEELRSGYFRDINNCVMTSLSIGYPENSSEVFQVSIKLQKIYVAQVEVQEAPEGSMPKTLTGYVKTEASVSSNTSTESGVEGNASDMVAAQVGDDSNLAPPESIGGGGMTQAEGELRKAAALHPVLTELEAAKEELRLAKLTGRRYERVRQGTGYIVRPAQ